MNNNTQKGLIINTILFFFIILFTTTSSMAAASTSSEEEDSYEGFNRVVFNFNDRVDIVILKPIATFYNLIIPKPLNQGIHNFFNNLGNFPTLANDILQANFYQAASDFWRLGINSTVGLGGFFDVAARLQLQPYTNDFGLTLARWGYKNSNYLVLPFFGPSSIRDGIGIPVDYFAFSVYPYVYPDSARYGLYGLGIIDRRARLLQFQPVMEEAAIDKYIFVRNAYRQHRAFQAAEPMGYLSHQKIVKKQ
jgi:phospholipid-binding lipoprotein MlaA